MRSAHNAAVILMLLVSACGTRPENTAVRLDAPERSPQSARSVPEPQVCGGTMCFELVGNKLIIYNTPGETNRMETDVDMPPDVASMKRSLMVYDTDGKTDLGPIDIQIDRKGVKSVTMRGKPVMRKE